MPTRSPTPSTTGRWRIFRSRISLAAALRVLSGRTVVIRRLIRSRTDIDRSCSIALILLGGAAVCPMAAPDQLTRRAVSVLDGPQVILDRPHPRGEPGRADDRPALRPRTHGAGQ